MARRAARKAVGEAPLLLPLPASATIGQPFSADILFVSDAEMRDLNRDFRGKDKPTDVLSFAQLEGEALPFAPPSEHIVLGDIVIALETADRQARERHHSLATEVAFLTIHGALHLLGYDHGRDAQRRKMFALQDRLFQELLK